MIILESNAGLPIPPDVLATLDPDVETHEQHAWDEALHPRAPKGGKDGGKFVDKYGKLSKGAKEEVVALAKAAMALFENEWDQRPVVYGSRFGRKQLPLGWVQGARKGVVQALRRLAVGDDPDEIEYIRSPREDDGVASWATEGVRFAKEVWAKRGAKERHFNPNHAPAGTSEGGQFTSESGTIALSRPGRLGIKLTPTNERAFTGERTEDTGVTKQERGKLGERIAVQLLRRLGRRGIHFANVDEPNFPIDVVSDGAAYEVKAGTTSTHERSRQWRATIGEPGEEEQAWLDQASPEEKKAHNAEKMRAVMRRKREIAKELSEATGRPVKKVTIAMQIDHKRRLVDIYEIDGFHKRIGWNDVTEDEYRGSFSY